jgi:hypothetical protein
MIMKDTEFQSAIESLPRSIKPQRNLWPEIESRLGAASSGSTDRVARAYWRIPAIAAAVMMALTTGIFIGRGMELPSAVQAQQSVLAYALAGARASSELEYQAAFKELVPLDYSGMRLAGGDPESIRSSWDELQKTESSLLAALREYPEDLFLNDKLLDLRSQQLHFVKQMVMLEQNNWRRT